MRSVSMDGFGEPGVLRIVEMPEPVPSSEHVVIRVVGAGVNWIDVSLRAGRIAAGGLLAPESTPGFGWDVAGVIEAIGVGVTGHAVGDRVVGLRDVLGQPGTHAEQVALHQSAVVTVGASRDLVALAGLPLAGVTALGAVEAAGPGATVLVTGAGGVIGRLCVAIALSRGQRVIAAARSGDVVELRRSGASVIDLDAVRPSGLAAAVRRSVPRGADVVIDTANLGVAAHEGLRGAGTFVALVRPFAPLPLRGTRVVVQESWADPVALAEVMRLEAAGVIEAPEVLPFELADAAAAHSWLESGGVRGRVALVPASSSAQ